MQEDRLPARLRLQAARAAKTIAPWLDAADAALSLALWAVPGKTGGAFVSSLSWPTGRHVAFRPVAKDFSVRCGVPDKILEKIASSISTGSDGGKPAPSPEAILSAALSASFDACGFGPEAASVSFLKAVAEADPKAWEPGGSGGSLEAALASGMGIPGRLSINPAYASIRVASVDRPWELSAHERLDLRMRVSASPALEEFVDWWSVAMEGKGLD